METTATIAEKTLTVQEAAKYVGCSTYFIRRLIRERQIAHIRIAGRDKVTREALDAWFKAKNHR